MTVLIKPSFDCKTVKSWRKKLIQILITSRLNFDLLIACDMIEKCWKRYLINVEALDYLISNEYETLQFFSSFAT